MLSAASGKTLQAPGSQQGQSEQLRLGTGIDGDWWAAAEHLVGMAEDTTGFGLPEKARCALVEMTVDLIVLLTWWPGGAAPADRLGYLRTRRVRMEDHAPWLYALPPSARRLLLGTARHPSILAFVVGRRRPCDNLQRAWRRALGALVSHIEAVGDAEAERRDAPGGADAPVADCRPCSSPQRPRDNDLRPRRAGENGPGPGQMSGTERREFATAAALPADVPLRLGEPDNGPAVAAANTGGLDRIPRITATAAYTGARPLGSGWAPPAVGSSGRAPPSFWHCRRRACAPRAPPSWRGAHRSVTKRHLGGARLLEQMTMLTSMAPNGRA